MSRENAKVPQNSRIYLIAQDVQEYDPETGAATDLSSPTSVTFRIAVNDGTPTEVSGDQAGSDNNWYAPYDCPTVGDISWQAEFVKSSITTKGDVETFKVVASLADV